MHNVSLALYRKLVRSASQFPVKPVGRKVLYNIREVFEIYRKEAQQDKIIHLQGRGEAALRVLAFLRHLPEVRLEDKRASTSASSDRVESKDPAMKLLSCI